MMTERRPEIPEISVSRQRVGKPCGKSKQA